MIKAVGGPDPELMRRDGNQKKKKTKVGKNGNARQTETRGVGGGVHKSF